MPRKSRGVRPNIDNLIDRFGIDTTQVKYLQLYFKIPPQEISADIMSFLLAARSSVELRARTFLNEWLISNGIPTVFIGYEWMSFKMPGGSYTPDYSVLTDTGRWIHVEIKGSHFQSNYKDSRSKIRAAASLNPWFMFMWMIPKPKKEGPGWTVEVIPPDQRFIQTMAQLVYPPEISE